LDNTEQCRGIYVRNRQANNQIDMLTAPPVKINLAMSTVSKFASSAQAVGAVITGDVQTSKRK